ncbi:MAG: pentapeptide repeat-containing protein [Cyanobacteria bacterium J06638_28]
MNAGSGSDRDKPLSSPIDPPKVTPTDDAAATTDEQEYPAAVPFPSPHALPSQTLPNSPETLTSDQNGHSYPSLNSTDDRSSLEDTNASRSGESPPAVVVILVGLLLIVVGLNANLTWLTLIGALLSLVLSWGVMWPSIKGLLADFSPQQRSLFIAIPAFLIGILGLMQAVGINRAVQAWGRTIRWDILGALGDFLGAFGQILVALLALYVAWRQYVISRDLTVQQNRITQQQTIDAYFQGISELVLDDEGLLEDWPQERIIAEARTAAILSSVDAPGKAKVIRFLSRSKLLAPLKRDRHLGRPILDGNGGYAEDRQDGLRVINLGAMLANADLSRSDLRWVELSDVNLIRADLSNCDLARANFSRSVLYCANLSNSDLMGTWFFYGSWETASPRSRTKFPDFQTGEFTGAVIEDVDFSAVQRLSEEQRQYCCRWGGKKARSTIPGGCEGIPNCLE